MQYYYKTRTGVEAGPVSREILGQLLLAGEICPETLVRPAETSEWKSYRESNLASEDRGAAIESAIRTWRPTRKHLRALGWVGIFAAGATAFFLTGPLLLELLFNRTPDDKEIAAELRPPMTTMVKDTFFLELAEMKVKKTRTGNSVFCEAEVTYRSTKNLYAAADFRASVLERGFDSAVLDAFVTEVRQMSDKLELSSAPPAPLSVARLVLAQGQTRTVQVKFTAEKYSRSWGVRECWRAWLDRQGWRFTGTTPAVRLFEEQVAHSSGAALLLGQAATDAAFDEYIKRANAWMAEAKEKIAARNESQIREQLQTKLQESVAERFEPRRHYLLEGFSYTPPTLSNDASGVDFAVKVDVLCMADLVTEGDIAELGPKFGDDAEAVRAAREDLMRIYGVPGEVPAPQVLKTVKAKGTRESFAATARIERQNRFWRLVDLNWDAEAPLSLARSGGVPLSDFPKDAIVLGTEAGEQRLREYFDSRKAFVADMKSHFQAMERRWGTDQAAWALLHRVVQAHGGLEAFRATTGYVARYKGLNFDPNGNSKPNELTLTCLFPDNVKLETSVEGDRRSYTICYTPRTYWHSVGNEVYSGNRQDNQPLERALLARNILFRLLCDNASLCRVTKLEDGSLGAEENYRLNVQTAEGWEYELSVDRVRHRLRQVRYHEPTAKKYGVLEFHYTDKEFRGLLLPSRTVVKEDSRQVAEFTLTDFHTPSRLDDHHFRHPLAGPPFTRGDGRHYAITVFNSTPSVVQLYVDDAEVPKTLNWPNGTASLTLEGGRHQLTVVGLFGGGANRNQKVYRYTLRLSRPGSLHLIYRGDAYQGTGSLGIEERMF